MSTSRAPVQSRAIGLFSYSPFLTLGLKISGLSINNNLDSFVLVASLVIPFELVELLNSLRQTIVIHRKHHLLRTTLPQGNTYHGITLPPRLNVTDESLRLSDSKGPDSAIMEPREWWHHGHHGCRPARLFVDTAFNYGFLHWVRTHISLI